MDTTCLLDLEPLLSEPIVLAKSEPVRSGQCETWHPNQVYYCDKIRASFPEADERLVQQLGDVNYIRSLRCQILRNHMQLAEVSSNDVAKDKHDGASSKFHDAGVGSSVPRTFYADTVMSHGENDIQRVRLSPLPAQAMDGVPFACGCCGKLVSFDSHRFWEQHIFADLQPWVCLEAECPKARITFRTRRVWIAHLKQDHGPELVRMTSKCPLCRRDTGSIAGLITAHLSSHLEEISLDALAVECAFEEETIPSELKSLSTLSESRDPGFGPSASYMPNNLSVPLAKSIQNQFVFSEEDPYHDQIVSSDENPPVVIESDNTSSQGHFPRELPSLKTRVSAGKDGVLQDSAHKKSDKVLNESSALTTEDILGSNEESVERT